MENRFEKFISYLLHPLLMPTYMCILFFSMNIYVGFGISIQARRFIVLLIFFNTFLIPLFASLFLKKMGIVKSLEMETSSERRWPLLITSAFYLFTYYLLLKIRLSGIVYVALIGAMIALAITTLVNLRWKISAHMVGMGGITGVFLGIALRLNQSDNAIIMLLFLLSGLLGYSRLKLGAHSPAQLYWGYFVGITCQLLLFMTL